MGKWRRNGRSKVWKMAHNLSFKLLPFELTNNTISVNPTNNSAQLGNENLTPDVTDNSVDIDMILIMKLLSY